MPRAPLEEARGAKVRSGPRLRRRARQSPTRSVRRWLSPGEVSRGRNVQSLSNSSTSVISARRAPGHPGLPRLACPFSATSPGTVAGSSPPRHRRRVPPARSCARSGPRHRSPPPPGHQERRPDSAHPVRMRDPRAALDQPRSYLQPQQITERLWETTFVHDGHACEVRISTLRRRIEGVLSNP